jgi:rare lipoprotein A
MPKSRDLRAFAWALATAAIVVAGCAEVPTAPAPSPPPTTPPEVLPAPTPAPEVVPPTPPPARPTFTQRGLVSLYGDEFAGRKTASGAIFDPTALTMAHRTLPFGTRVRVTNLENRRSVEVVVNDRGPAVLSRIADLSAGAAGRIGMVAHGVVEALLEVIGSGPGK